MAVSKNRWSKLSAEEWANLNPGAYASPFSKVGLEFLPLGAKPEEVDIVLHEVGSAEDALAVADKIRIAASAEPIPVSDGIVKARFSIGISIFPDHGITSRELLSRADQALYTAKARGRGRCAVFEG